MRTTSAFSSVPTPDVSWWAGSTNRRERGRATTSWCSTWTVTAALRHDAPWRSRLSTYRGSSPRLVSCDWTVLTSTESATFISGLALLTTSPLAAAFLPRIRLGPPFRFEVTTGIQGPDPILSVSLLDAMGGTLRLANREMEEIRPTVTLRRGDTLLLEATGEYG